MHPSDGRHSEIVEEDTAGAAFHLWMVVVAAVVRDADLVGESPTGDRTSSAHPAVPLALDVFPPAPVLVAIEARNSTGLGCPHRVLLFLAASFNAGI